MDFVQFFRILRSRFGLIAAVFGLTLATTVLVSLALPKKYQATSTLYIDQKSTDQVSGQQVMPLATMQAYLATQVDIIKSDRVVQRVISTLELDKDPVVLEQAQVGAQTGNEARAAIARWMRKKLEIEPSREGSTLTLILEGHDPEYTSKVVNTFAQAYIDTSLDLQVEPAKNYATWFEQKTKAYRDEVDKAQARLSAFAQASGIVASDERYDVENARLQELSSQLVQLQSAVAEGRSRSDAVRRDGRESMPEVVQNQLIQTLKAELGRAEARMEDMGSRLGANHPQMQAAQAEVTGLRSRLQAEIGKVTSSISSSSSINQQREAEIRNALEAQRQKVLKLKNQRDQLGVYQRDVDSARKALEIVTQRLTQTNLESQVKQSNVSVLTPAVTPVDASRPKPLLNGIVAAVVGAILGVFAALILEMVQKPVRTPEDLMVSAGVPVLAVLPPSSSRRPQRLIGQTGPTMRPPTLRLGN